ncbi:MAG: UvrD-helicase domain-containing protein [Deltaproteobacteria bacterium]|nr:UvrD-helicase domain-containing protein [Deltaproteobacteria bacterium]
MRKIDLTTEQLNAVFTLDRSLCIRAGAGCGKTGVLAYHYVALLLIQRMKPQEIVAVTFTEKAAGELKERVQKVLKQCIEGDSLFQERSVLTKNEIISLLQEIPEAPILTFHGLSGRIVRELSLLTGRDPQWGVIDENRSQELQEKACEAVLKEILDQPLENFTVLLSSYGWSSIRTQLREMISNWPSWKKAFLNEEAHDENHMALRALFLKALQHYEALKQEENGFDFNDLEETALILLKKFPKAAAHYQKLWKALLVDEFQDTNAAQEELIHFILGIKANQISNSKHLAIVGDEKQSIYSFRGAKPHIFEKFQNLIEQNEGITHNLTQNFRSPNRILQFVNQLFSKSFNDYPELKSEIGDSDETPTLLFLPTLESEEKESRQVMREKEAEQIALYLKLLFEQGERPEKVYILFRAMSAVSIYESALRKHGIATYLKSNESLFERQEVVDLIHCLRCIAQPDDLRSFVALLRSPLIGFSDEEILKIRLKHSEKDYFKKAHPLLEKILASSSHENPYPFLNRVLEETRLIELYQTHPLLQSKALNILQFMNWVYQWEKHHFPASIQNLDLEIASHQKNHLIFPALSDQIGGAQAVTLMSIHQAKGLDFPIVILPNLTFSMKPHRISIAALHDNKVLFKEPEESNGLKRQFKLSEELSEKILESQAQTLEEEDRILYVASTRATERLILGQIPKYDEKAKAPLALKNLSYLVTHTPMRVSSHTSNLLDHNEAFHPPTPLTHFSKRKTHFSVSELECFVESKEAYYKQYFYRIPASAPFYSEEDLSAADRGSLMHDILYLISNHADLNLNQALDASLYKRNLQLSERMRKEIFHTLKKTLDSVDFQKILQSEGYSEIPFILQIEPYQIQGSMDRLVKLENSWSVMDYKTDQALFSMKKNKSYEFQLKTYCLAASKMRGDTVEQGIIYWIENNKQEVFHFSNEILEQHENHLKEIMDLIQKEMPYCA